MRFEMWAAAAAAMLVAGQAGAATLVQSLGFSSLINAETENGGSVAYFDTSLGSLTSVTFNIAGTTAYAGGSSTTNSTQLTFGLGPITVAYGFQATPNQLFTFNLPYSCPDYCNLLYSARGGFVPTAQSMKAVGDANSIVNFTQQTVTYTYTPTPPVPEPSTWAMLILGTGAIGYVMRRRRVVLAPVPVPQTV